MLDMIINFMVGLLIIGIPCFAFYKVGESSGIKRGERRQILRELIAHGVIERSEPEPE